jgi:Carboxypeptidase regulatory-like domain
MQTHAAAGGTRSEGAVVILISAIRGLPMLSATAICLAALAQAGADRPEVFRGLVVEKGTGRPLAGVSVRFSDEPEAPTATTDERGRFDRFLVVTADAAVGRPGPPGWVRAENDRTWPWKIVERDRRVRNPGGTRWREAIQGLYEQAQTRWKADGPGASLIVECPPIGEIEAVVRGPDGLPLADRPILVDPVPDPPHPAAGAIRLSGRTDRAGTFRLRSFEGIQRLAVRVPALGFGATGHFEVLGGKVSRPALPPLVRFARVEGRLGPGLLAVATDVALRSEPFHEAVGPEVPCDAAGRFAMVDVLPGAFRIVALRRDEDIRTAYREVQPQPGATLRDVVLEPAPPPEPMDEKLSRQIDRQLNGDRRRTITWVEGTIRDEKGGPLPGASVYLQAKYSGGLRTLEEVKKTTADDRGRYRFEGPLRPSIGTLTVVASANGRPPAVGYAPGPDASLEEGELKPARLDLALAPAGASASVTVFHQDGRKLRAVPVRLSSVGAVALANPGHAGRARGGARDEVAALLAPTAETGLDGVARFENLLPGAFRVSATGIPEPTPYDPDLWPPRAAAPAAIVEWIAAPPGGTVEAAVAVHRQPEAVRFRLFKPDGSPVVGRHVRFAFSRVQSAGADPHKLDGQGIGRYAFESPGLWSVRIQFRDSELESFPFPIEPYYLAEALVPVSPSLALEDPFPLRSVRHEPGAIRARLKGADGKPARGTVMIIEGIQGGGQQAGTADAEGVVRFTGLASGKHRVRGVVDGQPPVPRPRLWVTRLPDEALRGHAMVFDREVVVAPGAETVVDLRLEPVGYVRATIRAPAGRPSSSYSAYLRTDVPDDDGSAYECDSKAGTYLFGPARPGRWPIVLREHTGLTPSPRRGERPVVVEPGQVVRVEVEPDPSPARPMATRSRLQAFLGMGGISLLDSGPEGFAVTVFLADGATPAFAARADFFPPDGRYPTAQGIADASGRLTWSGLGRSQSDDPETGPEPLKEPTVAAWMPGLSGPVVATVEPGKPLRLVLPAPAGVSGRVTLGGREIGGRDARVWVVVAAEGRGALAGPFGREVTADPDGRFRLPGLAPGRYRVQAARDEIWLSRSVPLVIEPGKDAAPIDLDIPEPGAPVAVDLVDRRGRPIPGLSFAIRRPEGPLAAALPMAYRTDERGSVIVRGLEGGPQSLVADGDPEPHAFTVPPARGGGGEPGGRG